MPALIQDLLEETTTRLMPLSGTSELDAQVLLAHVINKSRTWILAHPVSSLTIDQFTKLNVLIHRLEIGEPIPYVLGHWEFFGLIFDLTPEVLIPRPETELLTEGAIAWLQGSPDRRTVADIGTGSGCIAISCAIHVPDVHILATDISLPALKVARLNALKFKVAQKIDFVQCDLLPRHINSLSTDRHFDLICSNLPYIPTKKLLSLPVYGHEPTLALDGGEDGLDPFRKFFKLAPEWMAPGGRILLEIEASRGLAVLSLAYDTFPQPPSTSTRIWLDMTVCWKYNYPPFDNE